MIIYNIVGCCFSYFILFFPLIFFSSFFWWLIFLSGKSNDDSIYIIHSSKINGYCSESRFFPWINIWIIRWWLKDFFSFFLKMKDILCDNPLTNWKLKDDKWMKLAFRVLLFHSILFIDFFWKSNWIFLFQSIYLYWNRSIVLDFLGDEQTK